MTTRNVTADRPLVPGEVVTTEPDPTHAGHHLRSWALLHLSPLTMAVLQTEHPGPFWRWLNVPPYDANRQARVEILEQCIEEINLVLPNDPERPLMLGWSDTVPNFLVLNAPEWFLRLR